RVGDGAALNQFGQRLQVGERRRALVHPQRPTRAVAHDVKTQLATRRLDADIRLAGGWPDALGPQLEVVDDRLHALGQLFTRRRHDLAVAGLDRPARHAVERLPADLDALAHLGDADQIAVVAVAN